MLFSCPAGAVAAAVSEVTLGSFWAQFSCFSVLPCHFVFPSGRCLFNSSCRTTAAAAAAGKTASWVSPFPQQQHNSSSSSRKKQPKLSFSSGFRSYVRHFLGAIFVLLRPSVPWCFPIGEVSFQQQLQNNSSSSSSRKNGFLGFALPTTAAQQQQQ